MFESEIVLGILIVGWILYELYGRTALEWLTGWGAYIRMAAGVAVIIYLWWQLRDRPEEFKDTLSAAKDLLITPGILGGGSAGGSSGGTKEKRNVTGLMKKKIAASQGWKCGNCSKLLDETYEVDHKLALFKGGSNDMSNLLALCPNCHRAKTVEERLQ